MAESKEIIEFKTKKDILEKIAKQVICENCKVVPREPPIYLSSQRFVICSQCKSKFYLQGPKSKQDFFKEHTVLDLPNITWLKTSV